MKLVSPRRETSFYESFSDLVFNTLILLLVLVVALAVRLKSAQFHVEQALQSKVDPAEAADLAFYPNRFTGAPEATYIYAALAPVDGVTHVAFIPADIEARWNFVRYEGGADPVLDLCRLAQSADGLTLVPAADFVGLAPGITASVAGALAWNWRSSLVVTRLIEYQRLHPETWRTMDATALRDAIGGPALDEPARDRPEAALASSRQAWAEWSLNGTQSLYARHAETLDPLQTRLDRGSGDPPRIQFSIVGQDVTIGETTMSLAAFRGLLRAIKPGRGFSLEFVSPDGSEQPPPEWFIDQVLEPTGFGARLPRGAGARSR